METEGDGGSVGAAQSSVGAEDEHFRSEQLLRFPAHAGVLGQAEEVAGGRGKQHFRGNGQQAARTRRVGRHLVELEAGGFEDRG